MRRVTGAGPRPAQDTGSTGSTGLAGWICAGSARPGTGWTFWPLGVHALAPQACAAARGGPVQDAA